MGTITLTENQPSFDEEITNLTSLIQSFIRAYNEKEGFSKESINILSQINKTVNSIKIMLNVEPDINKLKEKTKRLNPILTSFNETINRLIFGEFYISPLCLDPNGMAPSIAVTNEINRILRVKRAYPALIILGELLAIISFIICLPSIVSIIAVPAFNLGVGSIMFSAFSLAYVYLTCALYTMMVERINKSGQGFSYFISKKTKYIEQFADFYQEFSKSAADIREIAGLRYITNILSTEGTQPSTVKDHFRPKDFFIERIKAPNKGTNAHVSRRRRP